MLKDEADLCTEFTRQFTDLVLYSHVHYPESLIWYFIPNGQRAGGWALANALIEKYPYMADDKEGIFEIINLYGAIAGKRDQRHGAKRGTPDYFFAFRNAGGRRRIGWLEAKHGKGTLSTEQKDFKRQCERERLNYGVFREVGQGFDHLRKWGVLKETCIY